jgi:hypothetical protein
MGGQQQDAEQAEDGFEIGHARKMEQGLAGKDKRLNFMDCSGD